MKLIFYFIFILSLYSCGTNFPKDIAPNYASEGFHSIEFDVSNLDGAVVKELGIANIFLKESSDYSKIEINIYGIYKGTLTLRSNACGIDVSRSFTGNTQIKLQDLISKPIKCSINVLAVTDNIEGKEHNIIESGVIKINVVDKEFIPLDFSYFKSINTLKEYSYRGQGSLQRTSGSLTSSEKINFFPKDAGGGIYRIVGCGFEHTGSFDGDFFDVSLKSIYKKDSIDNEDSCDFEVLVISNLQEFSHSARFSVNIYKSSVLRLEQPQWDIRRTTLGKKQLYVEGKPYVAICAINSEFTTKKNESKPIICKDKYVSDKVYWIRTITTNGRKNVFAIKNGEIFWQE